MTLADRSVLIVDDDPSALRLLEHHLKSAGYTVRTARNGREALHSLRENFSSLLITDWEMPEIDGLELCMRIREFEGFGWVYAIILTAHSEEDRIVRAFEAGADDYLIKPFKHRELLARLRAGERIIDLERNLARQQREIVRFNAEMEVANRRLGSLNERLRIMASTDELTGLPNRRAAMSLLEELWTQSHAHGRPVACAMLDIDHFKRVNDTYGHDVGDAVLREVAQVIQRATRHSECSFRFGGEEFLMLFPDSTMDMAAVAAERVRRAIEGMSVMAGDRALKVTASLGVADRTPNMISHGHLIKSADEALYEAKKNGRNLVMRAAAAPSGAVEAEYRASA